MATMVKVTMYMIGINGAIFSEDLARESFQEMINQDKNDDLVVSLGEIKAVDIGNWSDGHPIRVTTKKIILRISFLNRLCGIDVTVACVFSKHDVRVRFSHSAPI